MRLIIVREDIVRRDFVLECWEILPPLGLAGYQVLSFGEKELPKLSKYFHIIIIISMSFITFIFFGWFASFHCFGSDCAKSVLSVPLVLTPHRAILKQKIHSKYQIKI